MMIKIILTWCLFNTVQAISQHPILIVISYDAFRYDYFDTKLVPNMERLRKVGTYSDYMANVFPTKTFPNHHAIATGFYTESHGIIGDKYYDTRSGIVYKNSRELFHYDDDIVPIWRWNEDQGDGRYSASMMWPGAQFTYQGKNITNAYVLDKNLDFFKKVDIMMSWLTDPVKPANLVMFWEGVLDYAAHAFGPNAEEFKNALRQLDNLTKIIEVQLEKHNLTERTNVIHLSDHGIMAVPMSNVINFTQYIRPGTYVMTGSSPMMEIYPKEGYEKEVYDLLKVGSNRNGHFKVYTRDEFPKEWHYVNSRTAPILVLADVGYALENLIPKGTAFAKTFNFTLTNSTEFGAHGYDPTEKSMRPFFMARGPKIRRHHKVAPFNNTDLYNLFTEILEIPQRSNNGSMKNILDVLRIEDINDDVNDDIN